MNREPSLLSPLARAYTVFGEPCNDTCRVLPNDKASSCKKLNSNERIPCTTNPGVTSDGNACIGPCQRNGNPFFSCPTQDDSGYCTPGFLILKASHWETLYGKGIVSTDSFDSEEADQYEGIPLAPAYTVFGHPCQNECTASPNEKKLLAQKSTLVCVVPVRAAPKSQRMDLHALDPVVRMGTLFLMPNLKSRFTWTFTTKSYEEPKELEEIPFITQRLESLVLILVELYKVKSQQVVVLRILMKDSLHDGNTCIGPCEKKADDYFSCQTKESFGYCSPKFLNSTGDERIKDKNNIDKLAEKFGDVELAPAYTVYGEPCKTACIRRSSEQTMSCTESKSEERKPCTSLDRTTIHGYPCTGHASEKITISFLVRQRMMMTIAHPNDLMVFSFYPVDHEEARKYDQVSPAQAYSAFGEPCSDNCLVLPNESSASCTHSNQNERYPCTNSSSITRLFLMFDKRLKHSWILHSWISHTKSNRMANFMRIMG
ncbi:Uncharacterized protein FKW44_003586, partial [Caligus rogercresseyi]